MKSSLTRKNRFSGTLLYFLCHCRQSVLDQNLFCLRFYCLYDVYLSYKAILRVTMKDFEL